MHGDHNPPAFATLLGGLGANEVADGHGLGADRALATNRSGRRPLSHENGDESCEHKRLLSLVYSYWILIVIVATPRFRRCATLLRFPLLVEGILSADAECWKGVKLRKTRSEHNEFAYPLIATGSWTWGCFRVGAATDSCAATKMSERPLPPACKVDVEFNLSCQRGGAETPIIAMGSIGAIGRRALSNVDPKSVSGSANLLS